MADDSVNYTSMITKAIGTVESAIYLLVALFLVIMAIASFFIVAYDLSKLVLGGFAIETIYTALNDLLVILIIVELIQTVVVFVQSHRLDLRLILAAGLTAMIRRVLVFGVEKMPWEEMAITAVLLIVIIVGIFLLTNQKIERPER